MRCASSIISSVKRGHASASGAADRFTTAAAATRAPTRRSTRSATRPRPGASSATAARRSTATSSARCPTRPSRASWPTSPWSASWRRRFRSRDATSFAEQLGAWRVPGAHAPEALLAAAKQFVDACSVAFALDDPADDDGGFAVLGWGRRDPAALRFAMARNANRTRASNARLVADDSGDSASDLDAEIYEYARSHGTRQRERRIACGLGS